MRHGIGRLRAGGGGGPPYLGQVATRFSLPIQVADGATWTQLMGRRWHYARDDIVNPQVVFPWFYATETPVGANATITASIEYPAGTFTQVKFSGSVSGAITDGSYIVSDACPISIPNGAKFYTRFYVTCSGGIPFSARNGDSANGDVLKFGNAGTPTADKTMSDPMPTTAAANYFYGPIGIIAMTRRPSVLLLGDSRQYGFEDVATGTSGDSGQMARSIGPSLAYINIGVNGESAASFSTSNSTNRLAFAQWCSHIACNLGINDVRVGTTPATIYARLQYLKNTIFPGKPFAQATIGPYTTGSWDTSGGQTVTAFESNRVALNGLIRGSSGVLDYAFEVADVLETARDSGLWKSPGYTPDGLHELNTANLAIQSSGNINPALFRR